jgi:hypothetical protein
MYAINIIGKVLYVTCISCTYTGLNAVTFLVMLKIHI